MGTYFPQLLLRQLILILISISIIACQTESVKPAQENRVSIVSVKNTNFSLSASKGLVSWKPGGGHIISNKKINLQDFEPILKDAIVEALQRKGYSYKPSPAQGNFQISYIVALESELNDEQIIKRFGLLPGFTAKNPDTNQYEKGIIIVDIFDAGVEASIWRGAVQGFAHTKMSDDDRRKRVTAIIEELFKQFPSFL